MWMSDRRRTAGSVPTAGDRPTVAPPRTQVLPLDPFLVQSSQPSLLRPATALQGDLAAVLQEGRVLAGEVMQMLDGSTLLIGIGKHRVPAHSQVEMQPGHRFLFRVESAGDATVLRVLGEGGGGDHELLRALRGVLDQRRPMGELLTRLADGLRAQASPPPGGPAGEPAAELARSLLADLGRHVFQPSTGDGSELRSAMQRSGFDYEASLARLAFRSGPPEASRSILAEVEGALMRALATVAPSSTTASTEALKAALWEQLAEWFGEGDRARLTNMLENGGIERPARELERMIVRALRAGASETAEVTERPFLDAVRRADLDQLAPELRRALLKSLLGLEPFAPRSGESEARAFTALESDLKGTLLRSLQGLPEGPMREAVARALGGIEAEQLLNLARREGHQPLHWTLALPDGAAWTSAHLSYRYLEGRPRGSEGARAAGMHRVVVSVDFSRTGPVRADLFVREGSLTARLRVTRPEVARHLRERAGELEQRLAVAGRSVHLSIDEVPREDVAEEHVQDVRWLFEHHVMDLTG